MKDNATTALSQVRSGGHVEVPCTSLAFVVYFDTYEPMVPGGQAHHGVAEYNRGPADAETFFSFIKKGV